MERLCCCIHRQLHCITSIVCNNRSCLLKWEIFEKGVLRELAVCIKMQLYILHTVMPSTAKSSLVYFESKHFWILLFEENRCRQCLSVCPSAFVLYFLFDENRHGEILTGVGYEVLPKNFNESTNFGNRWIPLLSLLTIQTTTTLLARE